MLVKITHVHNSLYILILHLCMVENTLHLFYARTYYVHSLEHLCTVTHYNRCTYHKDVVHAIAHVTFIGMVIMP